LARKIGKKCRQELQSTGKRKLKNFPCQILGKGKTTFFVDLRWKSLFFYELGDQTRPKYCSPLIFQQKIGRVFDELGERFIQLERQDSAEENHKQPNQKRFLVMTRRHIESQQLQLSMEKTLAKFVKNPDDYLLQDQRRVRFGSCLVT